MPSTCKLDDVHEEMWPGALNPYFFLVDQVFFFFGWLFYSWCFRGKQIPCGIQRRIRKKNATTAIRAVNLSGTWPRISRSWRDLSGCLKDFLSATMMDLVSWCLSFVGDVYLVITLQLLKGVADTFQGHGVAIHMCFLGASGLAWQEGLKKRRSSSRVFWRVEVS